jgi:hypothetical protein
MDLGIDCGLTLPEHGIMGALIIILTSLAFLFLGMVLYAAYLTYDPRDYASGRIRHQHSAPESPSEQTHRAITGTS